MPNYAVRQIFSAKQEQDLAVYADTCSKMSYGISTETLRKLAYEMAFRNNIKVPPSWDEKKSAGLEWMRGFLYRCSRLYKVKLSIRKPEACSLSRLTSFNQHNVNKFFENLKNIYHRIPQLADGTRVYNVDETACTTVQKPKKILAQKGVKQVNQCTSRERGELVTVVPIICATGSFLPPALVFPRKNFKNHMLNGALAGTLGLASESGWMNSELFPSVIKHFIKHTGSSKENPTLLILDNHDSHLSLNVLDVAKEAGVTMLTLPPHTSHKLQPLDLTVFAPFKSYYNTAVDSWLLQHPGITFTIYNIADCVRESYIKAMTPSNIIAGFRKAGIIPFNENIFTDVDFLPSQITDRPLESIQDTLQITDQNTENDVSGRNISCHEESGNFFNETLNEVAGPSNDTLTNDRKTTYISPQEIRGFPKAGARKKTTKRQPGRSTIPTDTPERKIIEEKEQKKQQKLLSKTKKPVRKLFQSVLEEKDSDHEEKISLHDSSDSEESFSDLVGKDLERDPEVNEFVLIRFVNNIFYVGKIISEKDEENDFVVSYLRKNEKSGFKWPIVPDLASVNLTDIVMILPNPEKKTTKRLSGIISFPVKFGDLNIR